MIHTRDYMLKKDRERLGQLLAKRLVCSLAPLIDISQRVKVATKAGLLSVFYDTTHGTIFCRFDDPEFAAKVLYPGAQVRINSGYRLNPYSGKWNFHFGACTADEAFDQFEREYKQVSI